MGKRNARMRTAIGLALAVGLLAWSSPAAGIADERGDEPSGDTADVGCATVTIVWYGITPQIGEELAITPGVSVAVVGSYLWIQYVTGEPSSTANVHSAKIEPETTEMTICTTLHDSDGPDVPTGPDAPVETVEVDSVPEGGNAHGGGESRAPTTIVFLSTERDLVERWVTDHGFVLA